ncbi:condensin complex subunit 2 [Ptiloglossa arizonensis]|uniref:condensin complex subunit 2 n=1 Tax=Ptiloglossa arizonensis TaxID=3350558 RepID=UPI003FA136BC
MATHENEKVVSSDSPVVVPLNSSSSLRRKSMYAQNTLLENNDEEERLCLRREMNISNTLKTNVSSAKRQSLELSVSAQISSLEMRNRICECIKLNTENKINIKNAFSLEMIDFMTFMIKKQDADMSSLQVASTSLDVSTKIYGYRVDGIHTEIMNLAGGLDKQESETPTDSCHENTNDMQGNDSEKTKKTKRRRNKRKILSSVDSLKGTVEILKPSLWMLENEDSQTTDTLYQVILPIHANSKFYLHLYKDVIVDTIESETNTKTIKGNIQKIDDFSRLNICSSLTNFEFLNWTNNDEEEKDETKDAQQEETNENRFQFDLNASLPSEDEAPYTNTKYFDIENEEDNVNKCIAVQKPVEKIVDFYKVVTHVGATKMSEYSFLQKNMNIHWAGPSHWKLYNFNKHFGDSKVIEKCHQEQGKKRKEIKICYDDITKESILPKFSVVKSTRFENKSVRKKWQEEMITLPRDMHYNIVSATNLYYHQLIHTDLVNRDELNAAHVSDIEDYNYSNENDISNYCPNIPNDDYGTNEDNDNCNEDGTPGTQMIFDANNLVLVPKLVNKTSIAYSVCEKRIDMRQLKQSIWKALISNSENANDNIQNAGQQQTENEMKENKYFSDIYKKLPDLLTKANTEALSVPLAFVSLLHLANEKTLEIQSLPDMSDIIIVSKC